MLASDEGELHGSDLKAPQLGAFDLLDHFTVKFYGQNVAVMTISRLLNIETIVLFFNDNAAIQSSEKEKD